MPHASLSRCRVHWLVGLGQCAHKRLMDDMTEVTIRKQESYFHQSAVSRSRWMEKGGKSMSPPLSFTLLIFQVTGAFSSIGINADAGLVYFISRKSARESAKVLWRPNTPRSRDLPALRSNGDFAWGFWNQLPHNTPITAVLESECRQRADVGHSEPRHQDLQAAIVAYEGKQHPGMARN